MRKCEEARATVAKKNEDYSGPHDVFANLSRHGVQGILIRMYDKLTRLENLYAKGGKGAVQSESMQDNLEDLINYAVLAQAMLNNERPGPDSAS